MINDDGLSSCFCCLSLSLCLSPSPYPPIHPSIHPIIACPLTNTGKLGEGVFKGLPISLNGCRIIMENMDWESEAGEENEGIIGKKLFFADIGR